MALNQNQFQLQPILGQVDLNKQNNTVAVMVDTTQATALLAGQAVKVVDSLYGTPKVIACAANADQVFGFVQYNAKDQSLAAGVPCEVSCVGNVMFLVSTGAIARLAQVQLDVSVVGGVAQLVAASGARIVGYALDKATASGQFIRVSIGTPSFAVA